MLSVRLLFLAVLLGSAATFAVNRSTTEADHNWKYQFPSPSTSAYIESTTTLPTDLNQVTVTFWVKERSSPSQYVAYFSTPGRELEFYKYAYNRLYLYVNGAYTYCTNCLTVGVLKHIVVTWSTTADANGVGSFWVNGNKVHTFSGLSTNKLINKGIRMTLGQRFNKDASYPFGGEMMYLNVYATYVTTAEEVAQLAKVATSDPEAVIPWGSFIGGAHGDVVLYPEYAIYTAAYTDITCRENNMTVTLVRSAFPHLIPSRMSLRDTSCKVEYTEEQVTVSTGLSDCGTAVSYNESAVRYINYIVPDTLNPPTDLEGGSTGHAIINRGAIALDESRFYIVCAYPLIPHKTIAAYAVISSNFKVKGSGTRDFAFELKLYHDSSYKTSYQDKEYPLHADSKERIYAAALLASGGLMSEGENSLHIRVEKCVMTPDADPEYSTNHVLLTEGCPTDDTMKLHKSDNLQEQRFSFEVFRFNERSSAVVYMHCYIDVCQASEEDSKCVQGWSTCETE